MLKLGKLHLDWRECEITEHLYVQRCFKCCGFMHIAKECKGEQKCSECAGSHKFEECKRETYKCVNCAQFMKKYGADIDAQHHAYSKECKVYQRQIEKLNSKIEYSSDQ